MAIYAPSQFLPAFTAFITTPILTRLFLPAEYGYWALATSVSAFLVALAVSGFGSAVLRFYPNYQASSNLNIFYATLVVSILGVITVASGLSCLALILFKAFLPSALNQLLPLVIAIFVAQSVFVVFTSVLRAQRRSGLFTSLQLLTNYGGLGVGLLLVIVFGFRIQWSLVGYSYNHRCVTAFLDLLVFKKSEDQSKILSSLRCSANMGLCMAFGFGKCCYVGAACFGSVHHRLLQARARGRHILRVL